MAKTKTINLSESFGLQVDTLVTMYSKEKRVKVPEYRAVELAIEEALTKRKIKPIPTPEPDHIRDLRNSQGGETIESIHKREL